MMPIRKSVFGLLVAALLAFGVLHTCDYATAQTPVPTPRDVEASWKDAVRVATTTALPANTRSGNTLTATTNGALGTIDGVTLALLDRILVKNEATGANNGIYHVLNVGGASARWRLARVPDANTSRLLK